VADSNSRGLVGKPFYALVLAAQVTVTERAHAKISTALLTDRTAGTLIG